MATLAISLALTVGGFFLQQMFAPKQKDQVGPRLQDINVPAVNPGNPIVRHWGTMKLVGQLVWTSKLIETKHVEKAQSGGKGGKPKGPNQITYTYSVDCAIAVCRGPVHRIRAIRANQKLLWVNPEIMANGGGSTMKIEVWKDANYGSKRLEFREAVPDLKPIGLNDGISSIKAVGKWEVFEHANYSGQSMIVEGDIPNLAGTPFQDRISSMRPIYGSGGGSASAFEQAYYEEGAHLLENGVDVDDAHVGAFFFAFNNYEVREYTPGSEQEALNWIMSHPLPGTTPNAANVGALLDRMLSSLDEEAKYDEYKVRFDQLTLYYGDEAQGPDATIESYKGVGNVPAFRGVCYFVLKNLQLEDFGNAIPTFQIEVERNDGSVSLQTILRDVCQESGLTDEEFNVSAIPDDLYVGGFAVTQAVSGRAVIQDLQKVYPFDGSEGAYKLRFSWLQKRAVAILRREDFGAHMAGDEPPASEEVTRAHDFDLPQRISLTYQEPGRNYSTNTVTAQRMVTKSNKIEDMSVAIAMSRGEAKSRVEQTLSALFQARRTYKLILPRKYAILEPGDFVLIPEVKGTRLFYGGLITGVDLGANGLVEMTYIDNHFQTFISANASDDIITDDDEEQGPVRGSLTYPYLLDIPLLTDNEPDNVGFYSVLAGAKNGWNGGTLMLDFGAGGTIPIFGGESETPNDGSNWVVVNFNTEDVPNGFVMNHLPPAYPGVWDYTTRIRVYLRNPHIPLVSYSQNDLLAQPYNVCICGDELIQYADAEEKGNGVWELSTLLRGLRGTEWAIGKHEVGERFVRLSMSAVDRVTHEENYLNVEGRYRAVSSNQAVEDASDVYFANTGNSLRPYSPFVKQIGRNGDDVLLEWLPRVRQNGGLLNGHETVIDQDEERYEIDVVSGGNVVRSVQLIAHREWAYTAAMQIADFGSVQNKVTFRLYQVGRVVGRGFVTEVQG